MMAEGREEVQVPRDFQLVFGEADSDIWPLIFGHLSDPVDFQNLLLAWPEKFEPLLENRKKAVLFPLALKVLDRMDYIPKSTTLGCRSLSKFTKSSIDKWIRDGNPCLENLDGWDHDKWDPKHDESHCWRPLLNQRWQNPVENVNAQFNPFVGGYVSLNIPTRANELIQLLREFRPLVVRFGKEIRRFRVDANGTVIQCLGILRMCLEQMPNLRTLIIGDFTNTRDEEVIQRFIPSTLPNLRDFSTLHVSCDRITRLVTAVLEKYGNQLKKICTASVLQVNFVHLPLGFVGNLQHISLPSTRRIDDIVRCLDSTHEWLPNLETVTVNVKESSNNPIFTEVLVALENCFRTSRKLQNINIFLQGHRDRNHYIASSVRLSLPSLRRLWIQCGGCCLLSINFILGMRETLEEFTLDMRLNRQPGAREDSRFTRLVNRMRDSNLWDQMAKLERITIRRGSRLGSRWVGELQVRSYGGPPNPQVAAQDGNV